MKRLYLYTTFFLTQFVFAQFTCPKTAGTELVTNGNFESSGGFTSALGAYSGSGQLGGDQYGIATNPNPLNTGYFKSMGDHTSGSGKMLVADFNSASQNDAVVTFATIPVSNTQSYFFSAWFANVGINNSTTCATCPSPYTSKITNSPILKFQITNSGTGAILKEQTVNVDSLTNNWNQYSTQFTANYTGNIDIKIINLRGGNSSNDLALDDISFKAGCSGITDLSRLGKASQLPNTIYTCNENFAYALDTKLTNSKYSFDWYNSGGTLLTNGNGIEDDVNLNADKKIAATPSSSIYSVPTAPANNTKYYVCYDSTGDKLTCPRLDSVIFSSQFKFDIPDQVVCPPVSIALDPSLTTTNITSWKYELISPAPTTTVASGTGFVSPYTAIKAGTYRLTIVHANGSCTSAPDQIVVDTSVAAFSGAINASCSGGVATGTVTLVPDISGTQSVTVIGGNVKVSWFKTISGGSAVATGTGATGTTTTAASNLVVTPNCSTGGLFLQDDNSYATTVPLTNCSGTVPSGELNSSVGAIYQKITLTAPANITSINVFTKSNNGNGEDLTVKVELFPGTITNFNSPGTATATIATRDLTSFTGTTLTSVTVPGTSYVIQPGSYYIRVISYETANPSNVRAIGYQSSCRGVASNYQDNGATPVINFDADFREYGNLKNNVHGVFFNAKFQVGNPATCGRVWVCATCTLPVDYLYFNLEALDGRNVNVSWGTSKESHNKTFLIESSIDGLNFSEISEIKGHGNSKTQLDYSQIVLQESNAMYYRIKQIDFDGHASYTPVKYILLENNDFVRGVYPQPVEQGGELVLHLSSHIVGAVNVVFMNMSGMEMSSERFDVDGNQSFINVATTSLNKGIYLMKVYDSNQIQNYRVVIE